MEYFDQFRKTLPKWPYPVEYGELTSDSADVLIIGGGLAGCFAAIHAAERGASVIVLEKGATVRSGAAGSGIDHWMFCASNPESAMDPDEMLEFFDGDTYRSRLVQYIINNEAYDALLDFERMGMRIRDEEGYFDGAPFRSEESKLLYAYDYKSRYCVRLYGRNLKPVLYRRMKELGIRIYDRVMATSLLTRDGKPGARAIGATAVNVRTGRFYTFSAKATMLATAKPLRLWQFGTENVGSNSSHDDPNCAGDGDAMAWRAGAKLIMMERLMPSSGIYRYPAYSTGNNDNTWYPCSIVDADGREVPWLNRDNRALESVDERTRPAPGQKGFVPMGVGVCYEKRGYRLIDDLDKRIENGEFRYPFYADMTSMPAYERDVLFDMMLGNEGKCSVPIHKTLTEAGFDPAHDMLQVNIVPPDAMAHSGCWWMGGFEGCNNVNVKDVSFSNYGGLWVDWDLMTSLEGLFAAGNQTAGVEGASSAAASGRYCGRSMAAYAGKQELIAPDSEQIRREMERVYAPLKNETGYGWKEVQLGVNRMMQDYVGATMTESVLKRGLWWLSSIRENEFAALHVNNPHELARALECDVRMTAGEIIIQSALARTTNCAELDFHRLDLSVEAAGEPEYLAISLLDGEPVSELISVEYALRDGNLPTLKENYLAHRHMD